MKKKIPSSIKTEIFPIDIFKHGIRVVIGNEEDLLSVAECEGWRDEAVKIMDGVKDYMGLTLRLESGDSAILLSDMDGESISTPVVVHELIHAVSHILRNVGIEYSLDSEEVYAYVMEDLTEKVTNWISNLCPGENTLKPRLEKSDTDYQVFTK